MSFTIFLNKNSFNFKLYINIIIYTQNVEKKFINERVNELINMRIMDLVKGGMWYLLSNGELLSGMAC